MNETDKAETANVRVNDRRRFDPEGNLRPEGEGETAVPAAEVAPAVSMEEFKATQEQLEAARKRVDELARAYQALMQDREEFKQRLGREREQMLLVEKGNVAQALLETVDDLDLALAHAGGDESPLARGVKLVREGLLQKLGGLGVERLAVADQPFNPNTAEAADMEITTDPERDQWVVGEVRGGYRLKDRVIRPARVKVSKYVKPADA